MALTRPRYNNLNTNVEVFNDAITVLHGASGSADVDVGLLINRANGLLANTAIYWSETNHSFVTAFTSNSGATDTNISVISYANITTGNVYADGLYWRGNGQVIATGGGSGTYTNANVAAYLPTYTGNIAAGNVITTNGVFWPNGVAYNSTVNFPYLDMGFISDTTQPAPAVLDLGSLG